MKMGNYLLLVLTYIDKAFGPLEKKVEQFRIAFTQSRLEIPIEVCSVVAKGRQREVQYRHHHQ